MKNKSWLAYLLLALLIAGVAWIANLNNPKVAVFSTGRVDVASTYLTAGKNKNFLVTNEITEVLNTNMDVVPCSMVKNDPAYIPADAAKKMCYNWQGFYLPVPQYAFDPSATKMWEIMVMQNASGGLTYFLIEMPANRGYSLENSLTNGKTAFSNYLTEEQYRVLLNVLSIK